MSRINDRDYIYLIWKDYKTRQRYIVGELSKNGKYEFKYRIRDLDNAIEKGFEPLIAFPNINEVYENYDVFPAFSSRLPDKRRKDVKEILAKYKLEKYDVFELLKKSGGKLPTDSLEFIDPIFLDKTNIINKDNKFLGFIPIFFSKGISEAIDNIRKITCTVINTECGNACEECIKVRLTIE